MAVDAAVPQASCNKVLFVVFQYSFLYRRFKTNPASSTIVTEPAFRARNMMGINI